jgi:hypothetical protein
MARGPLAGASGPGKYSKRTDMGFGSTSYGEGGETAALNTAAPKSKTRGIADNVGGRPTETVARTPIAPLFSPTQRETEVITTGIDMGEGAGSEALIMRQPDDNNFRAAISSYMPVLAYISDLPNTSPETRNAIRQLRDNL